MSKGANLLFGEGFKKWAYGVSRWNRYGLLYDDCRHEYNPEVEEALRRLPQHIRDERNFRIIRAMQLSSQKSILPKEQWTKYEEDFRYLQPYIEEVQKEMQEKEEWDKE